MNAQLKNTPIDNPNMARRRETNTASPRDIFKDQNFKDFVNFQINTLNRIIDNLKDSRESRLERGFSHIGFMRGYCYARGWDLSYEMDEQMDYCVVNGKKIELVVK